MMCSNQMLRTKFSEQPNLPFFEMKDAKKKILHSSNLVHISIDVHFFSRKTKAR